MGPENTAKTLVAWRREDKEERPHSAIGNKNPCRADEITGASSPSVRSEGGKSSPKHGHFWLLSTRTADPQYERVRLGGHVILGQHRPGGGTSDPCQRVPNITVQDRYQVNDNLK